MPALNLADVALRPADPFCQLVLMQASRFPRFPNGACYCPLSRRIRRACHKRALTSPCLHSILEYSCEGMAIASDKGGSGMHVGLRNVQTGDFKEVRSGLAGPCYSSRRSSESPCSCDGSPDKDDQATDFAKMKSVLRLTNMKAALMGTTFILTGCTESIADLKCRDVESEVVALSKGSLIKITGSRVVTRSPSELVCSGTGIYSDNTEISTRYRAYIDEDREIMVAYDTDEAQAAEDAREQQAAEREATRVGEEVSKETEAAWRETQSAL